MQEKISQLKKFEEILNADSPPNEHIAISLELLQCAADDPPETQPAGASKSRS